MEVLDEEVIVRLAEDARIDSRTATALLRFTQELSANSALVEIALTTSRRLLNEAPAKVVDGMTGLGLGDALGHDLPLFYLLIALLEIPGAARAHEARGIPASVSKATWSDLAVWCHHLYKRDGQPGLSFDAFVWMQKALRGRLLRVGALQFELGTFTGPLTAYQHRETREIELVAMPGSVFQGDGRVLAIAPGPDTWTARGFILPTLAWGHRIDGVTGTAQSAMLSLPSECWEPVLSPGDPMMVMHIPASARLSFGEFTRNAADAIVLLGKLEPDARPMGVYGEGWLLDPQISPFLARPSALEKIRSVGFLYPARISESNTIQRLFGSSATRASVLASPLEGLNSLQNAVRQFLAVPENSLCARGQFVLNDELHRLVRGTGFGQ